MKDKILSDIYHDGYCFPVSDGSEWWITGTNNFDDFIKKFSSIMRLKKCAWNGSQRLIFKKANEVNGEFEKNSIFHQNDEKDVVYFVNSKTFLQMEYWIMWWALMPIHERNIRNGGMPFHAALVEFEGKGVLLAGRDGIGKTTCCSRLPNYWNQWCDNETLVVLNKNKEYRANPLPTWSDYITGRANNVWDVEHSLPFSAIFFLKQDNIDGVIPLEKSKASYLIYKASTQICRIYWQHSDEQTKKHIREILFNNACKISSSIPSYLLKVNISGYFWREIESILDKFSYT